MSEYKYARLLKPDEISCRVQQVTDSAGAIILLYKDARTDMNMLDETYGAMNWQREHTEKLLEEYRGDASAYQSIFGRSFERVSEIA